LAGQVTSDCNAENKISLTRETLVFLIFLHFKGQIIYAIAIPEGLLPRNGNNKRGARLPPNCLDLGAIHNWFHGDC
jgi:hypothetical protein